jgi:hypothetical protein
MVLTVGAALMAAQPVADKVGLYPNGIRPLSFLEDGSFEDGAHGGVGAALGAAHPVADKKIYIVYWN